MARGGAPGGAAGRLRGCLDDGGLDAACRTLEGDRAGEVTGGPRSLILVPWQSGLHEGGQEDLVVGE
eukprot:13015486-Heterocapsa_arctica.AAC.1